VSGGDPSAGDRKSLDRTDDTRRHEQADADGRDQGGTGPDEQRLAHRHSERLPDGCIEGAPHRT
jgi:hypothetical protein